MSKRMNSSVRRMLVAKRTLGILALEARLEEMAKPEPRPETRVVRLPNGVRVVKAKA